MTKGEKMLEGLSKPEPITNCIVVKKRAELSEDDKTIFDNALADSEWSSYQLRKALQLNGFNISLDTLRAHRQKACKCSMN